MLGTGSHPYSRTLYRHWIDEDGGCPDTRGEVLVPAAALGSVHFKDERHGAVELARWPTRPRQHHDDRPRPDARRRRPAAPMNLGERSGGRTVRSFQRHDHTLLFDGVFFTDRANGPLDFRPLPPPTDEEVGLALARIAATC